MSDFKAKMHKIRFPPRIRFRPRWGSLQRSPDPLAVFKGPTSNGREEEDGEGDEEGEGRGGKRKRKGRGGERKGKGRGGRGWARPPNILA